MATIIGLTGSNKIVTSRSITTEEVGIQRYKETFVTTTFGAGIGATYLNGEGAAIPAIYSQSARYPFMNVEDVATKEMPGELAEVTVSYVGFTYPIVFSWPPTNSPILGSASAMPSSISTIPPFGAATSKVNAVIRCSPAGLNGSDWKFYPLSVEIEFIDAVENEYKMLSTWRVGTTPMPTSFRGIAIPPPTKAPFKETPPNPPPSTGTFEALVYLGPVLKSLTINRRGNKYNHIRAVFRDGWFTETYNFGS